MSGSRKAEEKGLGNRDWGLEKMGTQKRMRKQEPAKQNPALIETLPDYYEVIVGKWLWGTKGVAKGADVYGRNQMERGLVDPSRAHCSARARLHRDSQTGLAQGLQPLYRTLKRPTKGPKPKLSLYKIFNYILYVLHTGIQWQQLKPNRKELHWSNVYKWHNRWAKDGSYQALFEASVIHLQATDQLDVSILHGDGSNTVVKKGGLTSAIRAINIKKGKKSSRSSIIMALS